MPKQERIMFRNFFAAQRNLSRSRLIQLTFATLLALTTAGSTRSQTSSATDGSTPLGLSPGAPAGSYALSGFDNINPYNGNLNFHLPLRGIDGRGDADTVSVLTIDAKSWTVQHRPIADGETVNSPTYNWWDPKPGYGPGILVGRHSGDGTYICSGNVKRYMQTLSRLTFSTADGTEYEFRDQLTGGQPATLSNPCSNPTTPSRGTVFITADGTAATFISDTIIYDTPGIGSARTSLFYPSGYLMLRDGSRFRIDGGNVTWMRDRNGNKASFTYNTSHQVLTITDSLNRQVTFSYADYSSTFSDQITFKGFGGTTRSITINHTPLTNALRTTNPRNEPASRYQIQTYKGLFPELDGSASSSFTAYQVSSVTLPNGRQYQFFYNCYGELARVDLPTGGAIEYDYTAASGANSDYIYRRVIERRVYPDGVNLEGYTTFSNVISRVATIDQFNATATLLTRTRHYFYGSPENSFYASGISYTAKFDGREYKTESYAADGSTLLRQSR